MAHCRTFLSTGMGILEAAKRDNEICRLLLGQARNTSLLSSKATIAFKCFARCRGCLTGQFVYRPPSSEAMEIEALVQVESSVTQTESKLAASKPMKSKREKRWQPPGRQYEPPPPTYRSRDPLGHARRARASRPSSAIPAAPSCPSTTPSASSPSTTCSSGMSRARRTWPTDTRARPAA